jgi:hypothetical protein
MHTMKAGRMTLLDWSLLAIGGMYGLGWVLVVAVTKAGGNQTWERWLTPFEALYPLHTLAALLVVIGVISGWYLPAPLLRTRPVKQFTGIDRKAAPWARAFWFMLLSAIIIQWFYSLAYGGFLNLLDYSSLIRSAIFEVQNPLSFLKPFGGLAMIAAYGFFGLWLSGRRKLGTMLGLTLSFTFSLYILYSWLGRMGFLVFLATFSLGLALTRWRNPHKLMFWGSMIFVVILAGAYGVSVWLNLKAADSFLVFLARELSFPFGSFFAQWNNGEHLFRGFLDFVAAPLYLLPSSWWSNWLESVGQVNTAVIMGAPKGEAGVTGAIPVDLLTLGLMQAHLVGIPIVGFIFGMMLRFLQFILDRIPLVGVRAVFEAYIALKIAVLGIFYAQPNLVVSGNFALIVGAGIIVMFLKIKRLRVFQASVFKQTSLREAS